MEDSTFHYSDLRRKYIGTLIDEADYLDKHGELPGIRFDFNPVDKYTHGLRGEDLWILAGDPGSGKTSIAMSLLRRRAIREMLKPTPSKGSLFVSLEMGEDATAMRWSQMIASMTTRELRSGMTRDRIKELNTRWEHEDQIPLWILFGASMKSDTLYQHIEKAIQDNQIDLIVIDHFRRIQMSGRYTDNSLDEARMQYIKSRLCKRLGVSCVTIAHTNKASAGRDDKKPRMSDLSGSQMVAAEADYITFVYRPYEYLSDIEKQDPNCPWERQDAYLVWRKNRNDQNGDARFFFEGSTMRIEDPANMGRPVDHQVRPALPVVSDRSYEEGPLF